MKMKNLLLLGAATLVVGCSQNIVDTPEPTRHEISFSHLNSRITRTSSGFEDGANDNKDDYKLYVAISTEEHDLGTAPIAPTIESTNWFIIDDIYGKTTANGIANHPKKGPYYWLSPDVALNFYAYAPATIEASGEPGALTIYYTVKDKADEDFTVATPVEKLTFEKTNGTGTVNLQFYHVLSKIVISAKLSPELISAGYTIEPGYTADLTMNCKSGYMCPTTIDREWSIPVEGRVKASYAGSTSYMVLPQNVEGNTLQIKGLIIKKNGIQIFPSKSIASSALNVYTLKATDVINGEKDQDGDMEKNDGAFLPGKQYNLNISINDLATDDGGNPVFGKELKLNAEVANWSKVSAPNLN